MSFEDLQQEKATEMSELEALMTDMKARVLHGLIVTMIMLAGSKT